MLLNFDIGEDSCESLGLQGDPTSQSLRKSVLNIHWKDWSWNSNILATRCEKLTHWKRPLCWEGLKAGEEDERRWDGWMASPTWWTWVRASSRSWWWTGRLGLLQFMGSQESDTTEQLNWNETKRFMIFSCWINIFITINCSSLVALKIPYLNWTLYDMRIAVSFNICMHITLNHSELSL